MKIDITESPDKSCPRGMRWAGRFTPGKAEYQIRVGNGHCESPIVEWVNTLTEARKKARASVRSGKAWAEVFRWAETGVSLRKVWICTYEKGAKC